MEEFKQKQNNIYEKQIDPVDAYLLRIVERFFNTKKINTMAVKNAIISEAIARYKASINYKDKGVRSFNGKEGIIVFTLHSSQIESIFTKKTAFNKDFGNEANTICSGNDYRLNNKREPLNHSHKLKDVPDFVEKIKNLNQNTAKYGQHMHNRKDILDKIYYSGTNFDFKKIEDAQIEIITKLNILDQKIAELKELETRYRVILDKNFAIINSGGI